MLALLLIASGIMLRPYVIPEDHSAPPVLTPTEVGFAQDMVSHHQQALIMVQRLDSGVDPSIRLLAQQISDAQHVEIGTMLGWLRLANASTTSAHPMAWMGDDHAGHHDSDATMPGMATTEQLDALSAARGEAAETLFVQLMLRHHTGGVSMAEAADELLESGPVKETVRGMITEQSQEAGLMMVILAQRGAAPLS
ncbi:DUF305 domain-containing protein [Nocardia sp. 2]|uniref:DUF305 domain-containing protein n=2 Tax=Nocardia acididurans TaxID=2802282 RepID=A0ABS1M0H1_9NOCA|nr:DUF305 domain-containing protein [Nocardia acididurans]MBL1074015.1 DUF305 domain-containing protein [Nocardia acididurans]